MSHPIEVVYATSNAVLPLADGSSARIQLGSHWPAGDPLVAEHPGAFSPDPRFGLSWTGQPPAYMALPPDAPLEAVEAAAASAARPSGRAGR